MSNASDLHFQPPKPRPPRRRIIAGKSTGALIPPRVLIVDDDPVFARIIQVALEKSGYEVLVANDARTGLKLAFREIPDLIILDYVMPNKDGLELLYDIRLSSSTEDIPVIMITASGYENVVTRAVNAGINDLLVKPFETDLLLARVSRLAPYEPETNPTEG